MMRAVIAITIVVIPHRMELQYPECSINAFVCYRYEVERDYGPFDYIGALQRGLERSAPTTHREE
jgi:hypothetical protein